MRFSKKIANFQIERWCEEAGGNIKINYQSRDAKAPVTPTDDTNPFWIAFKNATDELFVSFKTKVDVRWTGMIF